MKKYDVLKIDDAWKIIPEGGGRAKATAGTKKEIIAKLPKVISEGSVRIHKVNNVIQEERTYPRKADPRASKG